MKILKLVEISDDEVNARLIEYFYKDAKQSFYHRGNDMCSFPDIDEWKKLKWAEMEKSEKY